MNKKTTLILLILTVGLLAYIALVDRTRLPTDEREALARKAVLINPSSIDRIVIEAKDSPPFGCELRQGVWMMTSPNGVRADAGKVSRLLQKIDRLKKTSQVTSAERASRGLGWADYGLAPPAYRIKFLSKDDTLELWFGTGGTTNRFPVYLRQVGVDDILRVDDDCLSSIPVDSMNLRDFQIFRRGADAVTRLEISRPSGFVHLERDAAGRWRMNQPVKTRANPEAVQHLLDLLHTLRIEKYITDTDTGGTKYGLEENSPYIRVFHDGAEYPVKLTIGGILSDDPRLAYARLEGVMAILAVPEGMRQFVQYEVDALRDRQLLGITPDQLQSFRITNPGGGSLALRRGDAGTWTLSEPKLWPADEERVLSVLAPWYAARIASFKAPVDPILAASEAGPVLLEVEFVGLPVTWKDGTTHVDQQTFKLHESRSPGGGVLVHSLPDDTWFNVLPTDIRYTSSDVLFYRDRTVLPLVPNDLREIIHKQDGQESLVTREGSAQPWIAPAGMVADLDAIQAIIRQLCPLRADRLVEYQPADLGRYGLDQPRLTLTLGLAGETGISRSLLIGTSNPDGLPYAMIRGQDVVFLLPRAAVPVLTSAVAHARNADAGPTGTSPP